jgi:hypothetical protein
MPAVNSGRVSDKICITRGYKIRTLIFPVNYVIINMRAAGPTDKPLISFFQAKKERVKVSFLFPGCPYLFPESPQMQKRVTGKESVSDRKD